MKILVMYFCVLMLVSCGISNDSSLNEELKDYYYQTNGVSRQDLKQALHNTISGHRIYSYSKIGQLLQTTDEDPNNPNNILLFYSNASISKNAGTATWNKEHIWSQSHGLSGSAGYSDLHHLRAAPSAVNSTRSNYDFGNLNGQGTAVRDAPGNYVNTMTHMWEPADNLKGDVARMMLYMDVRYEGGEDPQLTLVERGNYPTSGTTFGDLSDLLEWNRRDPVSKEEMTRNNKVYELQRNRNPFIDNPQWADLIWQ